MMLVNSTPLEEHELSDRTVLVKREDLCCPHPGPSFSKMRGVFAHIKARPEGTIGVLDTRHSKAGWAVAYACKALGKRAVNFWPHYNAEDPGALRDPQVQSSSLGAKLVELRAGRSFILYHQARKLLPEGGYLMPNALKLPESVTENAAEAVRTLHMMPPRGSLVISISSGTVAAGVLKGFTAGLFETYEVVLHMGYSRSVAATLDYVNRMSGVDVSKVVVVDEGYSYADQAKGIVAPFPCNPYYDLKAWKWLRDNVRLLRQPTVFWNIGA